MPLSLPPGYQLRISPEAVDAGRFQATVARAEATADPSAKAALLSDALALWRGPAFADFADEEFARAVIVRLEERRLSALEEQAEARLALGEHGAIIAELGDLIARHPLRERLRAAHMRALYRSGRQSEALDSFEELRRHLADELGLDPGPEIADLHGAILRQDPALDAARQAPEPARPRTNLPAAVAELIGRDAAVAEVRDLLATARLVTLTGPGGVGKTRLAVESARGIIDLGWDGVWLAELAPLDAGAEIERVADTVLAALDIRDAGDPVAPPDRLAAALRDRRTLLVLDNCEHVIDAVAKLAERLLAGAPDLRILATSREAFAVSGEVAWTVPPLELPGATTDDAAGDMAGDGAAGSSAVRLFVDRAAAAARDFTLTPENAPAVAEICRRLDGIPLALELAATRVRALGVHGLAARLDDRFRVLAAGHRGAPPRQRTLTAVIDWSWDLLTEPERVVLRRLAVHPGGCTVEAAEAVCAGPDGAVAGSDVLGLLARLVDRSLVVRVDDPHGLTGAAAGPRYRLLESVAAYCADRVREAGELDAVEERMVRHYTALAVAADPHLRGHEQREWLRRLDAEAANLRSAVDRAARLGAAGLALDLTVALTSYWILRGRLTEARRSLATALEIAAVPSGRRAQATVWHTCVGVMQGDHTDWEARRDAALRACGEIDDAGRRARAEWFLGFIAVDVGDFALGEELMDRALDAFRAAGDEWGEATVLSSRAKLAHSRGDLAALEHDAERSVRLFRKAGDRWGELTAAEWLGALAELTGDYERSARIHRDGLRLAREMGLWPEVCNELAWLGWIAMQRGDHAQAVEHCGQALELATDQGFEMGRVFALLGLGYTARQADRLDEAEKHLRDLLDTAPPPESGRPVFHVPMVLVELGFVAELRGDAATARGFHMRAYAAAREQSAPRDMAGAVEGLAAALALAGRHVEAARLLGAAAAAQSASGLPPTPMQRADTDRAAAMVRSELGEEAFAAEVARGERLTLDEAEELAREMGDP